MPPSRNNLNLLEPAKSRVKTKGVSFRKKSVRVRPMSEKLPDLCPKVVRNRGVSENCPNPNNR